MPKDKNAKRLRKVRHIRLRNKISGTAERPRLAVFRSLRHIYAQVIDDGEGRTLASASTLEPNIRTQLAGGAKLALAREVGKLVAERAKAAGVVNVVFDRGGYQFHGRVKELADGARQEGLKF